MTCERAEVTPAYGFRSVGGYGIRGWRVFCPSCGHLSDVYAGAAGVRNAQHLHRIGHTVTPRKGKAA